MWQEWCENKQPVFTLERMLEVHDFHDSNKGLGAQLQNSRLIINEAPLSIKSREAQFHR